MWLDVSVQSMGPCDPCFLYLWSSVIDYNNHIAYWTWISVIKITMWELKVCFCTAVYIHNFFCQRP